MFTILVIDTYTHMAISTQDTKLSAMDHEVSPSQRIVGNYYTVPGHFEFNIARGNMRNRSVTSHVLYHSTSLPRTAYRPAGATLAAFSPHLQQAFSLASTNFYKPSIIVAGETSCCHEGKGHQLRAARSGLGTHPSQVPT